MLQYYQRVCVAAQGGAQDVPAACSAAAAQGEVAQRLPPAARLLRRPVSREGAEPHRAGESCAVAPPGDGSRRRGPNLSLTRETSARWPRRHSLCRPAGGTWFMSGKVVGCLLTQATAAMFFSFTRLIAVWGLWLVGWWLCIGASAVRLFHAVHWFLVPACHTPAPHPSAPRPPPLAPSPTPLVVRLSAPPTRRLHYYLASCGRLANIEKYVAFKMFFLIGHVPTRIS